MPHTTAFAVLSAASLFAAAGCGSSVGVGDGGLSGSGGSGGGACTTIQGSCREPLGFYCSEYGGLDATTLMALRDQCTADTSEPGTWSSTSCTHAGAVGGCRAMQQGACVAVWLYVGTPADGMAACAEQSGTWVNP